MQAGEETIRRRGSVPGIFPITFGATRRAFRSIRMSLAASQLLAPPRWEEGVAHPQATSGVAPTCGWRSMPHCASRSETSSEPSSGYSTTSSRSALA